MPMNADFGTPCITQNLYKKKLIIIRLHKTFINFNLGLVPRDWCTRRVCHLIIFAKVHSQVYVEKALLLVMKRSWHLNILLQCLHICSHMLLFDSTKCSIFVLSVNDVYTPRLDVNALMHLSLSGFQPPEQQPLDITKFPLALGCTWTVLYALTCW